MSDSNHPPLKNQRVLISGSGIGGLVAAYWLAKAGASVTVLERASEIRREGHIIGIRKMAIPIVESMGLGETLRERMTGELGLKIVNGLDRAWASIPVSEAGFTTPLMIHRGELVSALHDVTKDKVSFIYGDSIDTIEEIGDTLRVTLTNRKSQPLHCDVLLVAEGMRSRTRSKIFDAGSQAPILKLGLVVASFSYKSDQPWARCYHIPNQRAILIRPDRQGISHAHTICRASDKLVGPTTSKEQQRGQFLRLFEKTGWESEKITKDLSEAGDLHIQEVAQVKCKVWSKGRTVLVGDSAYCPSPIGGMGATAAIVGGYLLAAELAKNPADPQAAFRAYEYSLRPWIEFIHKPGPMVAKRGFPETRFGILSFHLLIHLYFTSPARYVFLWIILILQHLGLLKSNPPPIPKIPSPSVFNSF
ncbi:hypothetical protein PTTG_00308 [Puccinia triticina 1-1 BBBD Race 1]|uniref:FAD_binding_3 domain-containing protein n=1 Tax=Puccinia triticina (isolate 1-1 / race 1 (BBBD)) TaxID=630390 RepID=A0A180GZI0_PUCT1|nr:hypothetical protein PTTG_00308 [Puccinia triticina 1-1 BBBD Race 1]WAR57338.1 hypothetical protein PtB15_8B385 [Puccinia triticina]